MCASFELQIKDILQQINKLMPNMRFNVSTEPVKNMLPLKSIDEIKTIERTFILKIGGHSLRETIWNALSRIFSNKCSIKCSWKGRRQNFGVAKLTLIGIMKEIILEQYTLTERKLDDFVTEWFRFGKQRFHREINNLEG